MVKKTLFFIAILVIGCLTFLFVWLNQRSAIPYEFIKKDTWTFTGQSHQFKVLLDTSKMIKKPYVRGPLIRQIEVYKKDASQKVQEIIVTENLYHQYIDSSLVFVVEDMNFDGHDDFRMLEWVSMSGYWNVRTFQFWFFNPDSATFERDTLWEKFRSPVFNATDKTFTTNYVVVEGNSLDDYHKSEARYKLVNNQPVLDYEEVYTQDQQGNSDQLLYTRQNVRGQMVKTPAD